MSKETFPVAIKPEPGTSALLIFSSPGSGRAEVAVEEAGTGSGQAGTQAARRVLLFAATPQGPGSAEWGQRPPLGRPPVICFRLCGGGRVIERENGDNHHPATSSAWAIRAQCFYIHM